MKRRAWFAQLKPLLWLTIVTSAFLIEQSTYTLDVVVTSENDSGSGTLRQAIEDINNGGSGTEPSNITFAPNVQTIKLLSQLPSIQNSVTIDGLGVGVNCDQLSPVDNDECFSHSITVTIDGSQIPTSGIGNLIGLLVCSDDVTIRGIRVANFSLIDNAQVAGIVSEGNNTLIECCEITNLNGNNDSLTAVVIGIQGATDTVISNCFVHILSTINHTATNDTTSGAIYGIASFKTASNCKVECLQTGNIVYSPTGSDNLSLTLETGKCWGITNEAPIQSICLPPNKQCECTIDCQGSECILIENCIVNCCQSGSVFAAEDTSLTIGECSGIAIVNADTIIRNSSISNIHTGSATLTEGTFDLTIEETFGIKIDSIDFSACVMGNTVSDISRGFVKIDGLNSSAILKRAVGIYGFSDTLTAENNSVSNITIQPVATSGFCSTVQDLSLTSSPTCIGKFATPLANAPSTASGITLIAFTVHACNNTVSSIHLGKRIANGEKDLIVSGRSSGISIDFLNEATVENNSVNTILGAKLSAGPAARGIFGGIGSNGIVISPLFDSFMLTAQNNVIEEVCEQSISTAGHIPHGYFFLSKIGSRDFFLRPPAQTVGLLVSTQEPLNGNPNGITIEGNTINKIVGANVHSTKPSPGTTAIGIAVKAPIPQSMSSESVLLCLEANNTQESSNITNNTIQHVWGGTTNTAYGILLDSTHAALELIKNDKLNAPLLFDIQNNVISNIKGQGTPQQTSEEQLLSLDGCGTETEPDLVTFIRFPYQPTSGIYSLFANCCTIFNNTITTVTEPNQNARGITTQASSDININNNSISKINGYGIFVGGALARIDFVNSIAGLIDESDFEDSFASTRNKIYSNSTFNNTKQGIELGLIDWNNYFNISEEQCASSPEEDFRAYQEIPEDSIAIYGNHNQIKPQICNVAYNRDGSIAIDYRLDSPEQPCTKFAIQFFVNSSNGVPHGEKHINEFDDPRFEFKTDVHGKALQSITFIPPVKINSKDNISAHVTVTTVGQSTSVDDAFKGDTSEFTVKSEKNMCPIQFMERPSTQNSKPGFASILNR